MYSADRRMDQKRYNQTDGYCQGSKRRKNSKGKDRAKDIMAPFVQEGGILTIGSHLILPTQIRRLTISHLGRHLRE